MMARRKFPFLQDQYYHIYNRGTNRTPIFRNEENYHYLLKLLRKWINKCNISVIAYCLMPNHYHFLFRQNSEKTVSDCIQGVFNAYSKAFNKMYKRSGTLFEGPFRAAHIDKQDYLIHLCRYIHRNPIDTYPPLVRKIEEWPYSNYPEWIGERKGSLIDKSFLHDVNSDIPDYKVFIHDLPALKVRCVFRTKPATHSGETCHLFRLKVATHSV